MTGPKSAGAATPNSALTPRRDPQEQAQIDAAVARFDTAVEIALGPQGAARMPDPNELTPAQIETIAKAAGEMLLDLPIGVVATYVPSQLLMSAGIDPRLSARQRLSDFGKSGEAFAKRLAQKDPAAPNDPPLITNMLAPLLVRSSAIATVMSALNRAGDFVNVEATTGRDAVGDFGLQNALVVGDPNKHVTLATGLHTPFQLVMPRPFTALTLRSEVGVTRFSAELLSDTPSERFALGAHMISPDQNTTLSILAITDHALAVTRGDVRLSQRLGIGYVSSGVSDRGEHAWFTSDFGLSHEDSAHFRYNLSASLLQPLSGGGSAEDRATVAFIRFRLSAP